MPPPGSRRRRGGWATPPLPLPLPLPPLRRISQVLALLLALLLALDLGRSTHHDHHNGDGSSGGGGSETQQTQQCPNPSANDGLSSFQRAMRAYPWSALQAAVDAGDVAAVDALAEQMLETLRPFLVLPPMEPPERGDGSRNGTSPSPTSASSSSASLLSAALGRLLPLFLPWPWRQQQVEETAWCRSLAGGCPPPLPRSSSLDCSAYSDAGFTGRRRAAPARVAHAVQFAFDADVLELLLWEIGDLVDVVFLLEGTRTHNRGLSKPLLWEELKRQPRFRPFKDKVVHLVMDDVSALVDRVAPGTMWELENRQERRRWERFVGWNEFHGGYFGPEDLVGFGDADNIPSRLNLHLLRHCELNASAVRAVDIGGWMPWGNLNDAFRPDHNVGWRSWSYADPTFWRVGAAMNASAAGARVPTRMRGKSGHFLLGGVHLTDPPYLPFLLAKIISCTECGEGFAHRLPLLRRHLENATAASVRGLQRRLDRFGPGHRDRVFPVSAVPKQLEGLYYVPWYLERLRGRYGYWWEPGAAEPRLEGDWGW